MSDKVENDGCEKVLGRIEFTEEQREAIKEVAGRDIEAMKLIELAPEDAKRLAPGIFRAAGGVMCW